MEQNGNDSSNVLLYDRKNISVNGLLDILSFDETYLTISTRAGKLCVEGEGLHILSLSLTEGTISLEGRIDGVFYESEQPGKKSGLFGRKS